MIFFFHLYHLNSELGGDSFHTKSILQWCFVDTLTTFRLFQLTRFSTVNLKPDTAIITQTKTANEKLSLENKKNNARTSSSFVSFLLPLFIGKPLPNSLECMSAPYSTVTSSSILLTNRQNSLSTSSVGTICTGKKYKR